MTTWVVAPERGFPEHPGAKVWSPPYLPLRIATRLYAGSVTARRIEARLMLRRVLAHAAARMIPHDATTVIAPSLCARPVFAEAKRRGLRTVLWQDLPCLRRLHRDLDRAAAAHPESRFLKNHRTSAAAIAEQEAEWVLADEVRARGAYAASVIAAHGANVAAQPATHRLVRPSRPRRVALAGIATPRHGIYELLQAQAELDFELIVRAGEGLEPHDLLRRANVVNVGEADVVVAPSWCEANLEEVRAAVSRGIPVIATPQASLWLGSAVTRVEAGDTAALVSALS